MKIMAVCGSGLGSSFMMEMNIKKVLKTIGVEAEVEHSDLGSVTPDVADVFVMAKDIAYSANLPEQKVIIINNINNWTNNSRSSKNKILEIYSNIIRKQRFTDLFSLHIKDIQAIQENIQYEHQEKSMYRFSQFQHLKHETIV